MPETIVVKGRLVGPTTVELMEPVAAAESEVDVVLRAPEKDRRAALAKLLEHMKSLPPGTRTREDIDKQIEEERNSWER